MFDTKLRLFIDTNVLIECIEEFDEKKSKTFMELFKNKNFENIELVTCDYALWELYGHSRSELYVRKLVQENKYGFINASNESTRKESFRKASINDMKTFSTQIRGRITELENKPLTIEKLIGSDIGIFGDVVEAVLHCSKLSYKDSIIFASAFFTNSHRIVTLDDFFSREGRIKELTEALDSLRGILKTRTKMEIEFKKPEAFSNEFLAKSEFMKWFKTHNQSKQLAEIINVWSDTNAIGLQCLKSKYFIRVEDYLCLIKFHDNDDFDMKVFKLEKGNLRDYETDKEITQGNKVTIRLPSNIKSEPRMINAGVYLYSE
jgi:predicted nucleic acid-binding protein